MTDSDSGVNAFATERPNELKGLPLESVGDSDASWWSRAITDKDVSSAGSGEEMEMN